MYAWADVEFPKEGTAHCPSNHIGVGIRSSWSSQAEKGSTEAGLGSGAWGGRQPTTTISSWPRHGLNTRATLAGGCREQLCSMQQCIGSSFQPALCPVTPSQHVPHWLEAGAGRRNLHAETVPSWAWNPAELLPGAYRWSRSGVALCFLRSPCLCQLGTAVGVGFLLSALSPY